MKEEIRKILIKGKYYVSNVWSEGDDYGALNLDEVLTVQYRYEGKHLYKFKSWSAQKTFEFENYELNYHIPDEVKTAIESNLNQNNNRQGSEKIIRNIISFLSPCVSRSSNVWSNVLPEFMAVGSHAKTYEELENEYKNQKVPLNIKELSDNLKIDLDKINLKSFESGDYDDYYTPTLKKEIEEFVESRIRKKGSGLSTIYFRLKDKSKSCPLFGAMDNFASRVAMHFNYDNPKLVTHLIDAFLPIGAKQVSKLIGEKIKRSDYHKMFYMMSLLKEWEGLPYSKNICAHPTYKKYALDIYDTEPIKIFTGKCSVPMPEVEQYPNAHHLWDEEEHDCNDVYAPIKFIQQKYEEINSDYIKHEFVKVYETNASSADEIVKELVKNRVIIKKSGYIKKCGVYFPARSVLTKKHRSVMTGHLSNISKNKQNFRYGIAFVINKYRKYYLELLIKYCDLETWERGHKFWLKRQMRVEKFIKKIEERVKKEKEEMDQARYQFYDKYDEVLKELTALPEFQEHIFTFDRMEKVLFDY